MGGDVTEPLRIYDRYCIDKFGFGKLRYFSHIF